MLNAKDVQVAWFAADETPRGASEQGITPFPGPNFPTSTTSRRFAFQRTRPAWDSAITLR